MTIPAEFAKFVTAVEVVFDQLVPNTIDRRKACFYWTAAAQIVGSLTRASIRVMPQAGSASWLAVPNEKDDGFSPTHYTYQFEPTPMNVAMLASGSQLPEIHAWSVIRLKGQPWHILDPSVKYVPELTKEAGIEWLMDSEPTCLCAKPEDVPTGWYYAPDQTATVLSAALIQSIMQNAQCISMPAV